MNIDLSKIPEDQKNPLVQLLLRIIQEQGEQIALLKDEIAKLKGQKPRPKIEPSKVADDAKNKKKARKNNKDISSASYTRKIRLQEQRLIEPEFIPEGSRFKGYEHYSIQDLRIESVEIQFHLAVYTDPNGTRIRGELPLEYRQGHFGSELQAYCISQYFQCHVTEPLLLEQLYELGIDISPAQLNNILIHDRELFHQEKEEILSAGRKHSDFINTDDTSSRHQGKNGYCTSIGSPLFSYFESTGSKSRVNFLQILQGAQRFYSINEECLNYAFEKNLNDKSLEILEECEGKNFKSLEAWELFLKKKKITQEASCRIATEAALVGGSFDNGIDLYLPIISDAAPQFALFTNGLCWVHEERHYRKLIPISENEREEIEKVRSKIWDFYADLKEYKLNPKEIEKNILSERFDEIFDHKYESLSLQELMKCTKSRKTALLLVLEHPEVPLHNNDSERDIREYAKRRKISGSTRSMAGRKARDTFTSLKKTCGKHGVSFWSYVKDRIMGARAVPRLSDLIAQKSQKLSLAR